MMENHIWAIGWQPLVVLSFILSRGEVATHATLSLSLFRHFHFNFGLSLSE